MRFSEQNIHDPTDKCTKLLVRPIEADSLERETSAGLLTAGVNCQAFQGGSLAGDGAVNDKSCIENLRIASKIERSM